MTEKRSFSDLAYDYGTGNLYRVSTGRLVGTPCKSTSYLRLTYKNKTYLAHRVCWYMYYGYWPTQVDHINGDRADNRIENLREVNNNQQATNKVGWGKSGKKGVYYHKLRKKWHSRVRYKGKTYNLGYFDDLEEAKRVYDLKAQQLHKEYFCGEHTTRSVPIP